MLGALLSWGAFVVALALAGVSAAAVTASTGPGAWRAATAKVVPALVTLAVTVPLVLLVQRRRREVLALARPGQVFVGAGVVLLAAAVVLVPAAMAGAITVTAVDPSGLVVFLLTNTALALALEAVPEELAFRGSVYGSLRRRTRPWVAAAWTTLSFVVAPAASIALTAGLGRLLHLPTPPPTFAPGGQDPVAYAVLLAVFGAVLLLARAATGSTWAAVGVHIGFLTVNRLALPGGFDTGVVVDAVAGAELVVLAYLLLAGLGLLLLRRRRRARGRSGAARQTGPDVDTTSERVRRLG